MCKTGNYLVLGAVFESFQLVGLIVLMNNRAGPVVGCPQNLLSINSCFKFCTTKDF